MYLPVLRRACCLAPIPLLAWAAFETLRLSVADLYFRSNTDAALDRAIELDPRNPRFLIARATPPDLERARQLAPASAAPLLQLGLAAERDGNPAEAERLLLLAARLDATYLPDWTLANFYLRRHDDEAFWKWVSRAARVYTGDLSSLYLLCLRSGASPQTIFERVVPPVPKAEREFVSVLAQEQLATAAVPAAEALARANRPKDRPVLLDLCDQLAATGELPSATRVWRAITPPGQTGIVSNGNWASEPSGRCLDWSASPAHGVSIYRPAAGGIVVELNGAQPDPWAPLRQKLDLQPGQRYRLRWRYRAELRQGAGIRWRVAGSSSSAMASAKEVEDSLDVTAAPRAELELSVARDSGAQRPEGRLHLLWVRMSRIE